MFIPIVMVFRWHENPPSNSRITTAHKVRHPNNTDQLADNRRSFTVTVGEILNSVDTV